MTDLNKEKNNQNPTEKGKNNKNFENRLSIQKKIIKSTQSTSFKFDLGFFWTSVDYN